MRIETLVIHLLQTNRIRTYMLSGPYTQKPNIKANCILHINYSEINIEPKL